VTAATYGKHHLFKGDRRLTLLQDSLFEVVDKHGWRLEAWAIFANHYHFIGSSPPEGALLAELTKEFHSKTARHVNTEDNQPGRRVWFSYWHTRLTYEKSYLARLHYVHSNAVKHGLARSAHEYPYCSASWFELHADPAWRNTVYSFPIDRVNVPDDF
jgi:putative transposase